VATQPSPEDTGSPETSSSPREALHGSSSCIHYAELEERRRRRRRRRRAGR